MRFFTRALSGLFLLAVSLGLLAVAGGLVRGAMQDRAARESPAREAREQVFAAPLTTLAAATIVPTLETFGEIVSRRTLEVRASAAGRVTALGADVEEGGTVRAGQLLFQIDPREAERAQAVAEADLRDAEAELEEARRAADLAAEDVDNARAQQELRVRAAERQRGLQDRGIGAAQAVETAELALAAADQAVLSRRQSAATADARVNQAETDLQRARIALTEAEQALEDTRVTAAFGGILSEITVLEGGLVSQNEIMATLIDPGALEVVFRVSAGEYARLLDGAGQLTTQDVTVMLEAGDYTLASPATIVREAAAVGEGQTGRQVFARLSEPAGFRVGDFVRAGVQEPPMQDVALLPGRAVGSDRSVLVLGEGDRLRAGTVEVLRRQGADVIVRPGDLAGAEVVTERSPSLGAGIKVRPVRRDAQGEVVEAAPEFLELSAERRAALVALVEGNSGMPEAAKERVLAQLRAVRVPAGVVERIEGRSDG